MQRGTDKENMTVPETIIMKTQVMMNGSSVSAEPDEESPLLSFPTGGDNKNKNNKNNMGGGGNHDRNKTTSNYKHNQDHHGGQMNGTGSPSVSARGGGVAIKPMEYLVSSRRKNTFWSLSLLIFFLGVIGLLGVWVYQDLSRNPTATPLISQRERADHARDILNKHIQLQSKTMAAGCEGTVLIMRHCEKHGPNVYDDDDNEHCSYLGMERAHYTKTLFASPSSSGDDSNTPNNKKKRWPLPSHLLALTPDRGSHMNFREKETLTPLSKQSGIAVEIIDPFDLPPRLFTLLQSGALCGRLVVVSLKHELIPILATALGCGPDQGCPSSYPEESFDQVWQLKFVFRPETTRTHMTITTTTTTSPVVNDQQDDNNDNNNENNPQADATTDSSFNDNKSSDNSTTSYDLQEDASSGPTSTADDSTGDNIGTRQRQLKHKHNHRHVNDDWFVYCTVLYQNFDPLAFSATVGDYAPEGVPSGGRWKDEI